MAKPKGKKEERIRSLLAGLDDRSLAAEAVPMRAPFDHFVHASATSGERTRYFFEYGAATVHIRNGSFESSRDPEWKGVLEAARPQIERAIAGVGRVELHRGGRVQSLGSAWLVRDDLVVTNWHVAAEFRDALPAGGDDLRIDFLAEQDVDESRERRVIAVHLAEGFDLAFFQLAPDAANDPSEMIIALSPGPTAVGQRVCAIGYPTRRLAHYDLAAAEQRFAGPFDVKRLTPGKIVKVGAARVDHDCSTLSGNSGGVLLDVATGTAVGLHYGGARDVANYAVPAAIVGEWLARIPRVG
jgi:hypothetical protein